MIYKEKRDFKYFTLGGTNAVRIGELIINTIAYYFSLALLPLVRVGFGRRSLNISSVIFTIILLTFLGSLSSLADAKLFSGRMPRSSGVGFSVFFKLHILFFIVGIIIHSIASYKRGKSGIKWYSRSLGISVLYFIPFFQKFSPETFHRFIEPLVYVFAGMIISALSPVYGSFLTMAGISFYVLESWSYNQYWHKILDHIDAEIMQETFNNDISIIRKKASGEEDLEGISDDRLNRHGLPAYGIADAPDVITFVKDEFEKNQKDVEFF